MGCCLKPTLVVSHRDMLLVTVICNFSKFFILSTNYGNYEKYDDVILSTDWLFNVSFPYKKQRC